MTSQTIICHMSRPDPASGKAVLADFLATVLQDNHIDDGTYIEPYAGGAGAALSLLFQERVHQIVLNDADPAIYSVWSAMLNRTNDFIKRIRQTEVTLEEWQRQRAIYDNPHRHSQIKFAFATFFLNRCNRSGIIGTGGPIGGYHQAGKWKVDARFNKEDLIQRIEKIRLYKDRIGIFNLDALTFLRTKVEKGAFPEPFVYLDPPYYEKSEELYLNHYEHSDHTNLSKYITGRTKFPWVMSYDNVPQIHDLYPQNNRIEFSLRYSAATVRKGSELLIHPDHVQVDKTLLHYKQTG